jgi:transcription elongation GreA/GreB family factor
MSKLKQHLYVLCGEYVKSRETEIRRNIAEAQEAANEDTKSSAGDKYETGREAMQQEIDLNLTRLAELDKLKHTLDAIVTDQTFTTVQPGAVVRTNLGTYYIAIGAGKLKVDDVTYYAISSASPIGEQMISHSAGHEFSLNGKTYTIESVG